VILELEYLVPTPAPDLARIRHVALDLDGTVYLGGRLFEFSRRFLAQLDALRIGYTFLTNNSSRSATEYLHHLQHLGLPATSDQVYTSALATIDYLHRTHPQLRRLFVLGTPSLRDEFALAGFAIVGHQTEPDAVVVGFDTGLDFTRLCQTAWWLTRGKPFFATHPDRTCPTDQPTTLVDCGSICACLEHATGRRPDAVLGKPDPNMLTGILARHGLTPDQLVMAGDRLYTDMEMARRAGAVGALVLTGETSKTDVASCPTLPDLVLPSLAQLGELLEAAQPGSRHA